MNRTMASCREGIRTGASSPQQFVVATVWMMIAIWGWFWLGPMWMAALQPEPGRINDFYQDWGSARNYWVGLDIYTPHPVSIPRHLGLPANSMPSIEYNAHPPTSVLLTLPLARLEYRDAVLVWNLLTLVALAISLKIVADELGLPWTMLPPTLALLAFCHPVYGNLYLGQLTLILVLLVTAVWALERSGRSSTAGLVVGAAAAIKLFPAYLVVYYVARGRIRPVGAAMLSFLVLSLTAALVLGPQSYVDYIRIVIPNQAPFWSCGYNLSFSGFWHKLFNPIATTDPIEPLWFSPMVARWGTLISNLVVTAIVAMVTHRARTSRQCDFAFAAVVVAMLLVSPVAWDFSLPLLLVPIALIMSCPRRPDSGWISAMLALLLAIDWVPQKIWTQLAQGDRTFSTVPWTFMLGAPSLKFYTLLGIFVLVVASFQAAKPDKSAC